MTDAAPRYDWKRTIDALDAERDCREIVRILHQHEFPWDLMQADSLAQFRTFAVPRIGELLAQTGEYVVRTQKRVDDTAIILATFLEHDVREGEGRKALRRLNNMHGAYDIDPGDMLYTLTTLCVCPVRWIERFGWRKFSDHEVTALVNHLRVVGSHMGIKDIPETYQGFADFFDTYEREQFGYSPGGAAVADTLLDLVGTYPPFDRMPNRLARRSAMMLMDEHLLRALRLPVPTRLERGLAHFALRMRGRLLRRFPPRLRPLTVDGVDVIRSYPCGYQIDEVGTFPRGGCPHPGITQKRGGVNESTSAATQSEAQLSGRSSSN